MSQSKGTFLGNLLLVTSDAIHRRNVCILYMEYFNNAKGGSSFGGQLFGT